MIECKSARQIKLMRQAGKIVAGALRLAKEIAISDVTTDYIDTEIEKYIRRNHCLPMFKGYRGYPRGTCISINEEVVHGIPGPRKLREGDILSVDVGVEYKEYMADAAVTIPIGEVSPEARRLIEVCEGALNKAIEGIKPGVMLSQVSRRIQRYVEGYGYSVVKDYAGHGIGRAMHEDPQVPNYVSEELLANDVILLAGTTLAIEPMICVGSGETEVLDNKWTVVTKDRKLSAHFEHTVVVTDTGVEILTVE
jgi:methionyl aminopeptidase